jgi:hypothetical protein
MANQILPTKRGVSVKKTSRALSFVKKAKNTLASAVNLEAEVIVSLIRGQIRVRFARILLKWIVDTIQAILRS